MTTYNLRHTTKYEYEVPVLHAHHLAHLRPRQLENQQVDSTELLVKPTAIDVGRRRDYFGNPCDTIEVPETHDCLEVTAISRVSVSPRDLAAVETSTVTWEDAARRVRAEPALFDALEFCVDSPLVRAHAMLREYATKVFAPGKALTACVLELNHAIHTDFKYESNATDISTPLAQVMRERRGVCQDFAHVAVGCLRSFGLPARYVSGYLETIPPPGKERLVGADASHAWASVFVPEYGWLDFDPTNDLLPNERHITVAWGRDFSDVSPLKGVVLGGGTHRLTVGVDVEPLKSAAPEDAVSPVPPSAS